MKTSKIFKRVLIVLAMLALVSAILTSSTFARYVSGIETTYDTRPAMFDIVYDSDDDPMIEFNYARDGVPGSALGHTEVIKHYDFSIKMEENEVRTDLELKINFTSAIADKIVKPIRKDREADFDYGAHYEDGLRFSYKVYKINNKGDANESLTEITTMGKQEADLTEWTYNEIFDVAKGKPRFDYRLEFTFYNNTLATNNQEDFFTAYQGVTITATGTQIEPVLD